MCLCGGLADDNARIIFLAVVLAAYMLAGAALFQRLESDLEIRQAAEFWRVYHAFRRHHLRGSPLALQRLHELLYAYGNASATGIINKRRRWDFSGSFHFVGTIVTTIGYGSTAPQTTAGKAAVVLYGFFGCSGGILFFNLFLERIITLLAWVLRNWHVYRLRRRLRRSTLVSRRVSKSSNAQHPSLPDILDDDDHMDLDQWKPSVYWVMLYLSTTSCIIACCAAALYASLEGWDYFDGLYFAFVSFTTIGFGDFVSTEKPSYPHVHWYRFANFVFLVMGCCCIYSLMNVTSIVIKQGLNYVIHKLQYGKRDVAAPYLPRKQSSVSTIYYSKRRPTRLVGKDSIRAEDSSETPRRMSGEMICMKDLLSTNKVSLAVMQKQLYDAAQRGGGALGATPNHQVLKPGAVGPLAIASEKFESKSAINRQKSHETK
ncbi:potassium channel subfamily K member 13-like [Pseudomyrmex gracilis]|uniref:potassium channel subfamily K member 13-like n=1 Tax=Pseudomyrmex gracilis TaxID=219809 RepID=UPI000995B69B|nr:potassium channel subfamily K member 13-like [Pseudomyrmex gracilis]